MSQKPYRTAPVPSSNMPGGIPYIIGNEAAERFSFYGMKAILFVFMTKYLLNAEGLPDFMAEKEAQQNVHFFVSFAYFTPVLGAIFCDWLLGKYRTILLLSIVYCLGHAALAIDETRVGLFIGLTLIGIGSGGIKPCVSAHVGDQFGQQNQHLLSKVFSWFYLAINLGALISMFLTPVLLDKFGPHVAFGVPGVLMFIATVCFWMGRYQFIHIPPTGSKIFAELTSEEGLKSIFKLIPLFFFVMFFWSLFDQTATTWIAQAEHMERHWLGYDWEPSQLQMVNSFFILVFAPLFAYVVYPWINRFYKLTPMRKIGLGLLTAALSFAVCAMIQRWIDRGETPVIEWQVLAYAILTAAEIMVSITCLEFSYTQAPHSIKSVIMSLYLLSVTMGNLLTAWILKLTQSPMLKQYLEGENYFWFFAGLVTVAAFFFSYYALIYQEKTYIHQEQEEAP